MSLLNLRIPAYMLPDPTSIPGDSTWLTNIATFAQPLAVYDGTKWHWIADGAGPAVKLRTPANQWATIGSSGFQHAVIVGYVYSQNHKALPDHYVQCTDTNEVALTDSKGKYQLTQNPTSGSVILRAYWNPNHSEGQNTISVVPITTEYPIVRNDIVLPFRITGTITGHVTYANGSPVVGFGVWLYWTWSYSQDTEQFVALTYTDSTGGFIFSDVALADDLPADAIYKAWAYGSSTMQPVPKTFDPPTVNQPAVSVEIVIPE